MSVLPAPLQTALPSPASPTDAALAQLARSTLALLQAAGAPVTAVAGAPLPGGLTSFDAGGMQFLLRLQAPLPQGTPVTLSLGRDPQGQASVQVAVRPPQVPPAAPPPLPSPASTPVAPAPTPSRPAPPVVEARPPLAGLQGGAPTSAPATPATATAATTVAGPTPEAASRVPTVPPQEAPVPARPAAQQVSVAPLAPQPEPSAPVPASATPPRPFIAAPIVSEAPSPAPQGPLPARSVPAQTVPVSATHAPPAASSPVAPPPVATGTASPAVPAPLPAAPQGVRPQVAATSQAVPVATPQAGTQPIAQATAPPPPLPGAPRPSSPPLAPAAATPSSGVARTIPADRPTQSAVAARAAVAGVPYRTAGPTLTATTARQPLAQVLADATQAAARQDSIVPLIARLAALGPRLDLMPVPAAQAALRLLAMRLDLTSGTVNAKALQMAVAGSGVMARTPASGDSVKSALLQLRGSLVGVLGAEIDAVEAVAARPQPPMRGDDARTVRAELPLPTGGEEPARGLLHHADAALSRLKLLQNASQPQDARPGAPAAPQEIRIEVPLLLGAQTGLMQLVVDREARRKDRPGERGWRMRFAMAFPQTGEVGAEIALVGQSVAVALWAEDTGMETAMAAGLETLRAALGAEGLEATSIRMRRRARAVAQSAGRLMDSAR